MKKNHLLLTAIILALVLCFSCGVFAADITSDKDNPNQYLITEKLQSFNATDDLWIGTLADWKAEGKTIGDTGTVFENGEAIRDHDIIITNGKVGIVLAVGTRNPWGYPAGSVLDAGTVSDMKGGRDTIWSAEVLVNGWDSWAPDNCGIVTFDVVKYDFATKAEVATGLDAVKVSRVYKIGGMDFDVVTYYGIAPGESYAYMFDQFTNKGEKTGSLSNRFALTNKGDDGGAMFGGTPKANEAFGGMVACYGKTEKNTYFTAMIMPGNVERINAKTGEKMEGVVEPSRVGGSVGYKCVRVDSKGNFGKGEDYSVFEKNEQRTYNTYIYIGNESNPQGALDLISKIEKADTVKVGGTAEPNATIVVKNGDSIFGWYEADEDGYYAFDLPKVSGADYSAYVEANGKADGKVAALPIKNYTDVETNTWYTESLDQLTLFGCLSGYPDGTFHPQNAITRAEFARMLYGTVPEDYKAEGKAIDFPDVEDGAWYKEAVDFLSADGVIKGYPDGTFKPGEPISRAEMASMIYSATEAEADENTPTGENKFPDVKPNSWYYEAVMVLTDMGVLRGYPDGTFKPDLTATRAETAKALYGITDTGIALSAGEDKVKVTLTIKDKDNNPLYAKVEVKDAYPAVRYNGDSVFLAREAGKVELEVAPGKSTAVVYGEGHWFYSNPVAIDIDTATKTAYDVTIDMQYDIEANQLAADLHHHANKNDAFADPEDAIPAMKAAGLDVGFITDHDFTVNNAKAYELAGKYNMAGFIPSEEISCSWAHFNVIPLNKDSYDYFKDDKAENHVMDQFAKLPVFVKQTHDQGAAITANHPWYSYGLFYANDKNAIPGGYTDEYDNIELNACCADSENLEVLLSAADLWTSYQSGDALDVYKDAEGKAVATKKAHYIVGGSDTHDVLFPGFAADDYTNPRAEMENVSSPQAEAIGYASYTSGKVRTIATVDENVAENDITTNGLAFAEAVVAGHSYTTFGPLFKDLTVEPGSTVQDSDCDLSFTVNSLAKIKDIIVLTENATTDYEAAGKSMYSEKYLKYDKGLSKLDVNKNSETVTIDFKLAEDDDSSWFAIMVYDENGNYAITNPYWVERAVN